MYTKTGVEIYEQIVVDSTKPESLKKYKGSSVEKMNETLQTLFLVNDELWNHIDYLEKSKVNGPEEIKELKQLIDDITNYNGKVIPKSEEEKKLTIGKINDKITIINNHLANVDSKISELTDVKLHLEIEFELERLSV